VPYGDPWILLTAIALATKRIRLGPMVTPLPRRRPWTVARQAVTLDYLSGGRFTLGVGLGNPLQEFTAFGEDGDLKVRAAKLDEGLAIVTECWTGKKFSFHGEHYELNDVEFLPVPLQQPRIPIWVGATWPIPAPLRRAARWDGVWAIRRHPDGTSSMLTPDEVRGVRRVIAEDRAAAGRPANEPFDLLASGVTPSDDPARAAAIVGEIAEAGATWWTERLNPAQRGSLENMRERIRKGPPRL
jgi:alkanesulfonate monooxygenase SsuD/methylene tetrahydromethanopterin reductase-like flavin-dependent oxidoreductase (luciferase family)